MYMHNLFAQTYAFKALGSKI